MMIRNFLLLLLVFIFCEGASAQKPLSLVEAYQEALKRSESVRIQQQAIEIAGESDWQTRALLLPTVSAGGTFYKREGFTDQKSLQFTVEQSLFQGLNEYYAPKATAASLRAEQWQLIDEKESIFESVSEAFYELLSKQKENEHLNAELKLVDQRIGELKKRRKIGRSRESEVLTAQSQKALLEVDIAQNQISLINAKQNLEFYVGQKAYGSIEDLPFKMPDLVEWETIQKAIPSITSIKVLQEKLNSKDFEVSSAFTSHLPKVDLQANYYLQRDGGVFPGSNWDVSVTLSVPLFQGGSVLSEVREAAAERKKAELELNQKQREELRDTKTLYEQAKIYLKLLESYQNAVDVSKKNYEIQKKEYRLGLVTNLEVFEALTTSIETLRKRDQAYYSFQNALAKLQVTLGKISL